MGLKALGLLSILGECWRKVWLMSVIRLHTGVRLLLSLSKTVMSLSMNIPVLENTGFNSYPIPSHIHDQLKTL